MRTLIVALAVLVCACGPTAEQQRVSGEQRDAALITSTIDTFETARDNMNWTLARSALSSTVIDDGETLPADQLVADWGAAHTGGKTRSRQTTQGNVTISGDTATVVRSGVFRYEVPSLTGIQPNYWQGTGRFEYSLARAGDTWLITGISFAKESEEGDPRILTHSPAELQTAVFVGGLTGTWRGTYCGNSSTTWAISTQTPERSWATEHWCNGWTCGDLDFQLSGANAQTRRLTARAYYGTGFSVTGFTIDFQVSADGQRLDGDFNGHPRCDSIHLRRTSTVVSVEPLSGRTPSSIYLASAEPPQRGGSRGYDNDAYNAEQARQYQVEQERQRQIQDGIDFRQQQQQWGTP